jgi:uncharacterized protein
VVTGIYLGGFAFLTLLVGGTVAHPADVVHALVPSVVLLACSRPWTRREGWDSGRRWLRSCSCSDSPLQVVPALLAVEAATGLLAGLLHHEFRNIDLSWRPLNQATRILLVIGRLGAMGAVASAALAYFALPLPERVIKTYVAILVLLMAGLTIAHHWFTPHQTYRPGRLIVFAVIAGVNKGLGGGGYGPVITLGALSPGSSRRAPRRLRRWRRAACRLSGFSPSSRLRPPVSASI